MQLDIPSLEWLTEVLTCKERKKCVKHSSSQKAWCGTAGRPVSLAAMIQSPGHSVLTAIWVTLMLLGQMVGLSLKH